MTGTPRRAAPFLSTLAIAVLLGSPQAAATPVARPSPTRSLGEITPVRPPAAAGARASLAGTRLTTGDTVWVFRDSLETLVSPSAEGQWSHSDGSAQPAVWHIDTTYACEGHSFWCGKVDSTWVNDPNRLGYDNSWTQVLQNFVDLAGAVSPVKLSFRHQLDIEDGFDVAAVEVFDPEDEWIRIASFTGVVHGTGGADCDSFTVVIPDSIRAKYNPLIFRFLFQSDIQYSSADGFYPGDGWALDNVTVQAGLFDLRFLDDFESGVGTWAISQAPAVGDFWRVDTNPPTQELCTSNSSKAWNPTLPGTGGLVARMDDRLISPAVAISAADQVFVAFDVYRELSLLGCMYYNVFFRTRNVGDPDWSAWTEPTGIIYFGTEQEWLRQTIALPGAAGRDSVQVRIGVKDYSQIYCDGVASPSGATLYVDNFAIGVIGLSGPVLTVTEGDLFHDTFETGPFFADDNWNAARGDTTAVRIAASRGLKSASLFYSLNGAPFIGTPLTAVGPLVPTAYFADLPAGSYPRGSELSYYFSATDSTDEVATLPVDAIGAQHYFRATILPAVQAGSALCAGDTARVLYVNAFSGPDGASVVDQSLAALGLRYDRYDVNAAFQAFGNTPGGADTADAAQRWPTTPVATLGMYSTLIWDVGERSTATLSAPDQLLLQSWLALPGKNRNLLLAGDNLASDLFFNGRDIGTFMSCTVGATLNRDIWENTPQDTLAPVLLGAGGTPIAGEAMPLVGGCPDINRFDAFSTSTCAGASARAWVRYPNNLLAATERRVALGSGDSARAILLGHSIPALADPVRRNFFLYRTLVDEMETPPCYNATAVGIPAASPPAPAIELHGAAPNPFNPLTEIRFALGRPARVRLEIFSVSGARVRLLADRKFEAGPGRIAWDGTDDRGRDLASGAYFLRAVAEGQASSRKLILLR